MRYAVRLVLATRRDRDEGATVCIASKQLERLEKARAGFAPADSAHLTTQTIDVASEAAVKRFFEGIGSLDHLVFTAGDDLPIGSFVDKDVTEARTRFETRFWGALAAVKHGVRSIRNGGSIVLTSGFSSTRPRPGWTLQASIQLYRREEQRLPVGRVGEAAEIATAYLYLMENSYATGTIVLADGGGALA